MKFALMKYDYTTNLGNEIQSIAAKRFLPKIDYYIDHEKLNLFQNREKVKMIMNGWYLDCLESWPPSKDIDPLLISMHFTLSANNTKKVISTPESKDFFSSYGPVGCRDYSTLNLMKELDIDSYYSGDLTLTLEGRNIKNDYKYIVVNLYNPHEIIEFVKTKTEIDIFEIQQESIWSYKQKYLDRRPMKYSLTSFYDANEKFFIAENLLRIYENAHCIITDRVHCALPCLALKTPVLFIDSAKFAPERTKGLHKLLNQTSFEKYFEDYNIFDVENPPKNPKQYLKIRKKLIKTAHHFTDHCNENYYSAKPDDYMINYQRQLHSKTSLETRDYMSRVMRLITSYESRISYLHNEKNNIILKQRDLLNKYENINSTQRKEIQKLKKIINRLEEHDK